MLNMECGDKYNLEIKLGFNHNLSELRYLKRWINVYRTPKIYIKVRLIIDNFDQDCIESCVIDCCTENANKKNYEIIYNINTKQKTIRRL
jgi:hypothetical protein